VDRKKLNADRVFLYGMRFLGVAVVLMVGLLVIFLVLSSWPAIKEFGTSFIIGTEWNPVMEHYGALPFIHGTILTSFLAVLIASPVNIFVALFLSELCPRWASGILSFFVEMMAAVPSIIIGMWGLFFLVPWVRVSFTPVIKNLLGWIPFFQGPSFGIGILSASLILAIMITPTITSLCREIFSSIPQHQKEAALALGSTRFEMIKLAVLRPSLPGITGSVVLGLGRALGETMAVAMVIGNSPSIATSIFAPGSTMASVIANEYSEATSDIHLASLCLIGLILFILTLGTNFLARLIVWKFAPVIKVGRS
jgi:phosphate transport system permease protein